MKLHLSNFGSHQTPLAHGPGRKWSIMALPRSWEHGEGTVKLFVPDPDAVRARHEKPPTITHEEYVDGFRRLVAYRVRKKGIGISPGGLAADTARGRVLVADGDTLLCACGVEKARNHRCHRVWAAAFLVLAGWEVCLDGQDMPREVAMRLLRPDQS